MTSGERAIAGPGGSTQPLVERYDVALLDLDGVVYVGRDPVRGAAAALEKARGAGMRLAFVTNNASRTPQAVSAHLTELGVLADPSEVVTSAQAAARVLAERLPPGSAVLVVGTDALRGEIAAHGLRVVREAAEHPAAVVQGYSVDTCWLDLAEVTAAIHAGALWVATNLDATIPSSRGPMPGNGAFVNAVRVATGGHPLVTGKPEPALHRESVQRTGATRPLVVGDRLDTDIEGAARAGCDSMLVLTGVTTAGRLLAAGPVHRPVYVAADLEGLLVPHPAPTPDTGGTWRCGSWRVDSEAGPLVLAFDPAGDLDGDHVDGDHLYGDHVDALRALCAAAWERADLDAHRAGRHAADGPEQPAADRDVPPVRPGDDAAAAVLGRLSLRAG